MSRRSGRTPKKPARYDPDLPNTESQLEDDSSDDDTPVGRSSPKKASPRGRSASPAPSKTGSADMQKLVQVAGLCVVAYFGELLPPFAFAGRWRNESAVGAAVAERLPILTRLRALAVGQWVMAQGIISIISIQQILIISICWSVARGFVAV